MSISSADVAFQNVRRELDKLYRAVSSIHYGLAASVPTEHRGKAYQSAAVRFALKINRLEVEYSTRIWECAVNISSLSTGAWEKDPNILDLWQKLALTVTYFSEHPTKQVATLIIDERCKLVAFAANRVPEGTRHRGHHYVENIRKSYIVCSERMALARLLQLETAPPEARILTKSERRRMVRFWIASLTMKIMEVGKKSDRLHDKFILTTTSLCEPCAQAVVPFRPRGLIIGWGGASFTRRASIERAQRLIEGLDVTYLQNPASIVEPTFV